MAATVYPTDRAPASAPWVRERSEELAAVRDRARRLDQHDRTRFVGKSEDEDLGHEGADLARREVHHRCHLPPGQALGRVVLGELRRALLRADHWAEVDDQLIGGPARLREWLGLDNGADANVDLGEIVIGDHG